MSSYTPHLNTENRRKAAFGPSRQLRLLLGISLVNDGARASDSQEDGRKDPTDLPFL